VCVLNVLSFKYLVSPSQAATSNKQQQQQQDDHSHHIAARPISHSQVKPFFSD